MSSTPVQSLRRIAAYALQRREFWTNAPGHDAIVRAITYQHIAGMLVQAVVDLQSEPAVIDAAHLERQRAWSTATFGPGRRTLGVIDHIRKELAEIEATPLDIEEWVDALILAFDGAWRAGWEPQQIIDAIVAKQGKNELREWPDWRTASEDKAIEHVRDEQHGIRVTAVPDLLAALQDSINAAHEACRTARQTSRRELVEERLIDGTVINLTLIDAEEPTHG